MHVYIMKLRKSLINYATLTLFSALLLCASPAEAKAPKGFAEPIRLRAGDGFMKAERGYATPCLADIDGDGTKELLVGQFQDGKIRIYEPTPGDQTGTRYDEGRWLEAGGKIAEVPGVW